MPLLSCHTCPGIGWRNIEQLHTLSIKATQLFKDRKLTLNNTSSIVKEKKNIVGKQITTSKHSNGSGKFNYLLLFNVKKGNIK